MSQDRCAGSLSKEWMIMTLLSLGYTETDAQVYVYLVTEGPQKSKDIRDSLKISRSKLYRTLKKLQGNSVVNASPEHPIRFSAVPFKEVLDIFIKNKIEQKEALRKSKEQLLSTWRSITKKDKGKS